MKDRALLFAALLLATVGLLGQSNNIDVPKGNHELMHLKGDAVQVYTCTDTPTGKQWGPPAPDAKLLDSNGKVIGTHSKGPTWTLNNGGTVQGVRMTSQPPNDKKKKSVDWLLLSAKEGTAKGSLDKVTYIQRTDTHCGLPNPKGCKVVGKTVKKHYTATYTFYIPD